MFDKTKEYKVELTSELVPFLIVDTYQKYDFDNLFTIDDFHSEYDDNEELQDRFEEVADFRNYYYEHFDLEKYMDFIFEKVKGVFDDMFIPDMKKRIPYLIKGEAVKIFTPKSYNYSSDKLYFDLYFSQEPSVIWTKFKKLVKKDKLNEFLYETYKSRPGFISYMPQSIEDIDKLFLSEEEDDRDVVRGMSAILTYILSTIDDKEKYQEEMDNEFYYSNAYILDFVNDSYNEMLDQVNENKVVKRIKSFRNFKQ